jgi:hypothetical protein
MKLSKPKPDLRELRAQFLKESKLFCRMLEFEAPEVNPELKGQMLDEMREKLKNLLQIINELEIQEASVNKKTS